MSEIPGQNGRALPNLLTAGLCQLATLLDLKQKGRQLRRPQEIPSFFCRVEKKVAY